MTKQVKTTKVKPATTKPAATTHEKRILKPHEVVLSPMIQSAVGVKTWSQFAGTVDLPELLDGQREQFKKLQGGDMEPIEAMLFGQAKTLETIFTALARKAEAQEYLKQFQVNLTLALKAQAQCRATLEALAEVRNPRPIAFVRQANITNGAQQINNNQMPPAQQAGSAQVGGGVESLAAPERGTASSPTQRIFPPGTEIQTVGSAAQAA